MYDFFVLVLKNSANLQFLDLKLLLEDELFIEGFTTGERLKINPNGPFTHLFVDNELRVQYHPSLKNIENEEKEGNIRGFQLQYMVDGGMLFRMQYA